MTHWLSYGGGVNSTALLIMLLDGRVAADPWRVLWADTRDEKDETYAYIYREVMPRLHEAGRVLEVVCGKEGVLERFERLRVTGNRILRACSVEAKIKPIVRHLQAHGTDEDQQLIGIDAGEAHRAKRNEDFPQLFPRRYPLIDMDLDREACEEIIRAAGWPVPPKSGCWHCPFMRVGEVIALAVHAPDRFGRIVALEDAANLTHPSADGTPRTQWGDKPARQWLARARDERGCNGPFQEHVDRDLPCGCYDGEAP